MALNSMMSRNRTKKAQNWPHNLIFHICSLVDSTTKISMAPIKPHGSKFHTVP